MSAAINGLHEPGTRAPILILNKVLDEVLAIRSCDTCPDSLCIATIARNWRDDWNAELVNEMKRC